MQGLFSAVWGVAAIAGPALGGLITTTIGWPWVFLINLPVGILAIGIIWFAFHERFVRRPQRIDWLGAALLTGGIVLLLVAVSGSSLGVRPVLATDDRAAGGLVRPARCVRRKLAAGPGAADRASTSCGRPSCGPGSGSGRSRAW